MAEIRKHGYARVSSKEQNEARQIKAFKEFGIEDRDIYLDKESGKDFNRKEYKRLINCIRKGDLLVIQSIDRLGRNYNEIMEQWRLITNELEADIVVLDMPLLDTRTKGSSLDSKFVADLVLQILSYVAEKERNNIKARQRQGIDIALVKGVKFGRPKVDYPNNWNEVFDLWVFFAIGNSPKLQNFFPTPSGDFLRQPIIIKFHLFFSFYYSDREIEVSGNDVIVCL